MGRATWLLVLWACLSVSVGAGAEEKRAPAEPRSLVQKELDSVEAELLQTRSELRRRKVELALQRARVGREVPAGVGLERAVDEVLGRDPHFKALVEQIQKLEQAIAEIQSRVTEKNLPPLVGMAKQKEKQARDAAEYREKVRAEVQKQIRGKGVEGVRETEDRIEFLTQLEKVLADDAASLRARLGEARGEVSPTVERLEREVKELKEALKVLLEKGKR